MNNSHYIKRHIEKTTGLKLHGVTDADKYSSSLPLRIEYRLCEAIDQWQSSEAEYDKGYWQGVITASITFIHELQQHDQVKAHA